MAVLYTTTKAKYDEHVTNLTTKRRRTTEKSENYIVKTALALTHLLYGACTDNASIQAAAKADLETIFGTTFTVPTFIFGTGTVEANQRRANRVAVTAGTNTITFSSDFDGTDYGLSFTVYTADGYPNDWRQDPDNRTASGFDIYVVANGFIDYVATYA